MPPRDYTGSDMLRMQRDAEMRVQQMRNRARTVAMIDENEPALNRNWSSSTGRSRQLPSQPIRPQERVQPLRGDSGGAEYHHPPTPEPPPELPELPFEDQVQHHTHDHHSQNENAHHNRNSRRGRTQTADHPDDGTIIGDVMGALGMEEDTLLIIGLLLILVNQKADTTLLLALAYLLI